MNRRNKPTTNKPREIRIIGGYLRSRKIPVLDFPGLRPTADRVRETLFNWLMPYIADAVCLDLFAGTGALSFEALSRGARKAILVDAAKPVVAHLRNTAQQLGIKHCEMIQAQIPADLFIDPDSIDIVFLDPPFHRQLISPVSFWLENSGWLKNHGKIYIETEITLKNLTLPDNWRIQKNSKAGNVAFYIIERSLPKLNQPT